MTENTEHTRAKAGGEYGVNGEFYEGGQFLPSSPLTIKGEFRSEKNHAAKTQKERFPKGKKQMTAPYIWEPTPEDGLTTLWQFVMYIEDNRKNCKYEKGKGLIGLKFIEIRKDLINAPVFSGVAGFDAEDIEFLNGIIEKFNNGERWIKHSDCRFM